MGPLLRKSLQPVLTMSSAGKLSRISLINYFGNDAPLSYLELENEEDSNVCSLARDALIPLG